ncbi:uncharacterized protein [Dendropsophus ebraccatus]|uniref:uncharacterized protein isoform X2 n=1 Tax=Dendropsophus ebraccatus TaxID=150705 RepID=UPI003831AF15
MTAYGYCRFLATGKSFSALHYEFQLETSTIFRIVLQTCEVIWQRLKVEVMPQPDTKNWLDTADSFYGSEQFPNCLGALNATHIRVRKPPHSGSRYFHSRPYYWVVLLALVDSDFRFVTVDVAAYGSAAEARDFRATRMVEMMQPNQLALPGPKPLPGSSGPPAPYVMVAGEDFGLSPSLVCPFPGHDLDDKRKIFNYRLGQAVWYGECALGMLSRKWRVLQSSMQMSPDNAVKVIQACVLLHNFFRGQDTEGDNDLEPAMPSSDFLPQLNRCERRESAGAALRDLFADYFLSPEGAVDWQVDALQ